MKWKNGHFPTEFTFPTSWAISSTLMGQYFRFGTTQSCKMKGIIIKMSISRWVFVLFHKKKESSNSVKFAPENSSLLCLNHAVDAGCLRPSGLLRAKWLCEWVDLARQNSKALKVIIYFDPNAINFHKNDQNFQTIMNNVLCVPLPESIKAWKLSASPYSSISCETGH